MDARILRARVLFAFGALGLLVGTLDPLEGAWLILVSTAALTLAVFLRGSPRSPLFSWALPLTAIGVLALHGSSSSGGFGGSTGRSAWWAVVLLPYGAGWLLAVVGAVRETIDQFRRGPVARA